LSTELYRHYDADGVLLYIGISNDSVRRWSGHRRSSKEWAHLSVRMEIERFPSLEDASEVEMKAIAAEKPLFNKSPGYIVGHDRKKVALMREKQNPDQPRNFLLQAYDTVLLRVEDVYAAKFGKKRGAITWFAKELRTSRQNIDNWRKRTGIPVKFVGPTARLLGMKKTEVRPATFLVEIAIGSWEEIVAMAPELAARCIILSEPQK